MVTYEETNKTHSVKDIDWCWEYILICIIIIMYMYVLMYINNIHIINMYMEEVEPRDGERILVNYLSSLIQPYLKQ